MAAFQTHEVLNQPAPLEEQHHRGPEDAAQVRRQEGHPGIERDGFKVEAAHRMARLHEVGRHGSAHVAETDEPDGLCHPVLPELFIACPTLALILRCPRQRASKEGSRTRRDPWSPPSRPPLRSGASG